MSHAYEVATRVLKDIDEGKNVSSSDAMYLRFAAPIDEITLSIAEIARRVVARENEPRTQSKTVGHG